MVSIPLVHDSEENYPHAASFDPDRFLGANPDARTWVPFGGRIRRCTGAAFATMEMDVVLRTLLRELTFAPTDDPDERRMLHGVVVAPGRGARTTVHRRASMLADDHDSVKVGAPQQAGDN